MAYKKKDLENLALKAIKKNIITDITQLATHLPISRATFYNKKLNELDSIKEAIDDNKINLKANLRSQMYNSDKPVDRIALYKLLGTPDERDALNGVQKINTNVNIGMDLPKMPMRVVAIGYEEDKGASK